VRSGREYKDAVYGQFALIGKALCSAPRLEILDVLLQAERTVEVLARRGGNVADGARRSSMSELTQRTAEADKVLVF
jgi:DNA-binding transcriptional ArsR family regulator